MEKEIDRKTVVLQEDENVGSVKIADDVVATIASLAATEVEGVSPAVGASGKPVKKYVRVEVLGSNVKVDVAVTLRYGYNIPATCSKVQAKIKAAVENMTGLTCSDVNIRIVGVKVN